MKSSTDCFKVRTLESKIFWFAHSILGLFPHVHAQDGLITVKATAWQNSSRFKTAKSAALPTYGFDLKNDWRVHTVLWAIENAVRRKSCVVECGTNRGWFMRAALELHPDLEVYMFDTFDGFDPRYPCANATPECMLDFSNAWGSVQRTFHRFENAHLIKGCVPDSLKEVHNIGMLHIDMDCVEPEIAALDFFLPFMITGGIIIGDDYGCVGFQRQQEAWDTWAARKNLHICPLPTGQALIVC